jgi:hypothetical protein
MTKIRAYLNFLSSSEKEGRWLENLAELKDVDGKDVVGIYLLKKDILLKGNFTNHL